MTPASQSHISHECNPLRWAISCKHEITPLHTKQPMLTDRKRDHKVMPRAPTKTVGCFTSIQMVHTHAPLLRGFFGRSKASVTWFDLLGRIRGSKCQGQRYGNELKSARIDLVTECRGRAHQTCPRGSPQG